METTEQFQKALEIFTIIKEESGKNLKEAIIRENSDNATFSRYLDFIYNSFFKSGLALKKIRKTTKLEPTEFFESPSAALDYIRLNNTGTDQVVANLSNFIKNYTNDAEEISFLEELFTQSYKCGVTSSTINKGYERTFIPKFDCQLAHPFAKYESKVHKGEFCCTQKLDGHRTLIFVYPDCRVEIKTRKGHNIFGLVEIEKAAKDLYCSSIESNVHYKEGVVLDGEICIADPDIDQKDIFQETSKVLKKDGEKTGLTHFTFDIIPYQEFIDGESSKVYKDRREDLNRIFYDQEQTVIDLVPLLYQGHDLKFVLEDLAEFASEHDWEGLMINMSDGKYVNKRTSNLLKVKKFFSSDVEVVDVYEGGSGTRLEGLLGGVVIQFKDFTVKVGSGFSDEERQLYLEKPDLIVGKIIEVQYFEETKNQKDGKSLRFPTYKGIREDKTLEDVSYES